MRKRIWVGCSGLLTALLVSSAVLFGQSVPSTGSSSGAALSGIVRSDAEGPMEGVLVSAKRVGGTITITVVSDSKGRYRFPRAKLLPGSYDLTIRAVGYILPPQTANVTDRASTVDLKLQPTEILGSSLALRNG